MRLGEISYEIFLIHVIMLAIATDSVLRRPAFMGSMTELFCARGDRGCGILWQPASPAVAAGFHPSRPHCDA